MADITVNIERISNTEYCFGNSTTDGLKTVATALTFDNPSHFAFSQSIEKFDRRRLTFRIGMLQTVVQYCRENNVTYTVRDYTYPDLTVDVDKRLCTDERKYQEMAVREFYKRRFGILKVPTRGGKTFIAAEILRQFFAMESVGNALFVVDSITLFTQAVDDFRRFFQPYGGISIGEICSGVCRVERVTVCMIQTVQRMLARNDRFIMKYLRELKMLCVDEIHDNFSSSRMRVYKRCHNLQYQLCLSATPYKAGEQNFTQNLRLREWSGDVVYEITEEQLRTVGVLTEYKVVMPYLQHTADECETYDDACRRMMYQNEVRDGMIVEVMRKLSNLHLKTLVLFQNLEHGRRIEQLTAFPFLSGETDGNERERVKQEFLRQKGGCLLASNIFKKGVTLPEVQVLINVDGGLEEANTIQRKGRVLGTTVCKCRSMVVDFIDDDGHWLAKHSSARMETYIREIGESSVTILDTKDGGWIDDFECRVRKWFVV